MSATCMILRKLFAVYVMSKVIHNKYSKHRPYTVAHTIECVCSKINHGLNHGLFISLLKPRHIKVLVSFELFGVLVYITLSLVLKSEICSMKLYNSIFVSSCLATYCNIRCGQEPILQCCYNLMPNQDIGRCRLNS